MDHPAFDSKCFLFCRAKVSSTFKPFGVQLCGDEVEKNAAFCLGLALAAVLLYDLNLTLTLHQLKHSSIP